MQYGTFPFGEPVLPVCQLDRSRKQVFVLGVYASAVHARWIGADGRTRIHAVAVASEPEIFWRGEPGSAQSIIDRIALPRGAGRLVPAREGLNGPSGMALDTMFLEPLVRLLADGGVVVMARRPSEHSVGSRRQRSTER